MEAGIEREASRRSAVPLLVGTAVVLYVADQVTKAVVVASLEPYEIVPVLGDVVQIRHAQNTGAAFSILPGATWIFVPVTILALGMVAWFARAFRDRGPGIHVVLGMILAGSLGNLTDRLRLGYVIDWIDVGIGDLRWPTFNIADPSVVIGIGLLVAYLTFVDGRRDEPAA